MPRYPKALTPEEIIIGYFVTKPLDRVQETLSHVQTIVKSRMAPSPALSGEANTAPRPTRRRRGVASTMPAAASGTNHRASEPRVQPPQAVTDTVNSL